MAFIRTTLLLGLLTGLFLAIGFFFAGIGGAIIGFVLALFINFISFWYSDKIVLRMYGAKPLEDKKMLEMIKKIAKKADIPMPKAYIVDMDIPNAFATGRSPKHAAIAVTKRLMDDLEPREVEAVIGHELSHVKNRDTLISTIAATMAGALTFIAQMALFRRDDHGNATTSLLTFVFVPIAASLIRLAISRGREFSADKCGAMLTNPLDLASALEKISSSGRIHGNNTTLQNSATSHLFIINSFSGSSAANLLSTHPPTQERVKRLKNMIE